MDSTEAENLTPKKQIAQLGRAVCVGQKKIKPLWLDDVEKFRKEMTKDRKNETEKPRFLTMAAP